MGWIFDFLGFWNFFRFFCQKFLGWCAPVRGRGPVYPKGANFKMHQLIKKKVPPPETNFFGTPEGSKKNVTDEIF